MAKTLYSCEQATDSVLKDKRVVIIDDFKEFRDSLRRTLLGLGARLVDTAEEANDAISKISRVPYDIILCDYNLGEGKKDGQQIFEELSYKKKIGYSSMFIMITAENTLKMVMGVMDYQPDGYLVKPFTTSDLVQRIKAADEKKQLFSDIDRAMMYKDYLGALAACDELMNHYPKYLIDILKVKGDIFMLSSDYKSAENVYSMILKKYRLVWAEFNMGRVYFYTRRFMDARNTFRTLIDENDMFIPAYDWLARSLEELGDKKGAQGILEEAVSISPRAIFRQRALGNVSFKNKDFDTAETSFKQAVKLGKTSVFKESTDYTQLAKVFIKKHDTTHALSLIEEVRADFSDSDDVLLQATLIEGHIYAETDRHEKAIESLNEAERIMKKLEGKVSPELAIDLSETYIKFGEKEKGMELLKYVVMNNHSDNSVINRVQDTFRGLGMGDEGIDFVAQTKAEIIGVNNKGVDLINKGMLPEAIALFEKAADGLPSNFIINLNALRAIVGYLLKNGRDDRYLYKCEKYIERINDIDPNNMKFLQLVDKYNSIKCHESSAPEGYA
ncbi:MAG: response regulator [Nitrospirae bacterium]|nr:response regulator [Nitrospirota bacterium]MBF0534857.1 response regulator [Nitrospirota bacterium]MBF0616772.1 response regulator [Nitrospirota bacterium]